MKIVYVGDNRNRDNFGCRATSTALSQIISKNHTIVGRIYGHYTNGDVKDIIFNKHFSEKTYKKLIALKHWSFIRECLILWFRLCGMRSRFSLPSYDFISYDWDKSINNLKKCIVANPVLKECDLEQYDFEALVVNGEGSFIFSQTPWREALVETMLMYWALKLGKKVYFMNAMFSAGSGEPINMKTIDSVKEVLESVDYLGVREYRSLEFAKKYFPNANIHLYPDALFSWYETVNDNFTVENGKYFIGYSGAFDETYTDYCFDKKYVCVSGSSSRRMGIDREKTIDCYCDLICEIKKRCDLEIYIVIPCSGDDFLKTVAQRTQTKIIPVDTPILAAAKILSQAECYITGRYHPAILASLGGTPCVFMGSNSHKNSSLQEILEYEKITSYNEIPEHEDVVRMVDDCLEFIKKGSSLRNKIKNKASELSELAIGMKDELR